MSMVITLNPLLKVSAGQWNTLVNFASALCGLADQICIGANKQFIEAVDAYIRWYNEKRIKVSLGRLSPVEYRHKLGLAA